MLIWRRIGFTLALTLGYFACRASEASDPPTKVDPFAQFQLPDEWEARFWASPDAQALFSLESKALADLVPIQAGIRFCRCPACDTPEAADPLRWSVAKPKTLTCKHCGATVPNDKFPAHAEKKEVPEETIEVLPKVVHKYPYHEVELLDQQYGGERLYIAAKRDSEAREFLSKAAIYAALRYRRQSPGRKDPALARVACVILVRFGQVYPAYATHFDQPRSPKFFQPADLAAPYRRNYATAKWDWTGSSNVPLNLVVAYALLRDDIALNEAGKLLGENDPRRLIERDFFQAAAEFVRKQPGESGEASLEADRGILAVGRLLNDPVLISDAIKRLERFAERGFYHDGFWRQGNLTAHRRVLDQLDGWIEHLLTGTPGASEVPMLTLAHSAGSAILTENRSSDVFLAGWPAPNPSTHNPTREPRFLGGTGIARLAIGKGDDALDLELRGLDSFGPARIQRQALRVSVGGVAVLGDLDDLPDLASGFNRASVSRNTVVVDGLNQRESLATAREPAPGGDFRFFAADPDFQVVMLDDRRSYPTTTKHYRQTIIASTHGRSRFALSVFDVQGGLQHDQLFHAPSGSPARWEPILSLSPPPSTLLGAGLTYVPSTRPDDDRWFVQSFGEFRPIGQTPIGHPTQATCATSSRGIKLHLLGDPETTLYTATTPDPQASKSSRPPTDDQGRCSLILRRQFKDNTTSRSTFVTLFEPVSTSLPALDQVARVTSPPDTVVVAIKTPEGGEYLVVNLTPGTPRSVTFPNGKTLRTDGLAVRLTPSGMTLAGGTFAEHAGRKLQQNNDSGRIMMAVRALRADSRGWFETAAMLPNPEDLAGRTLLIEHGDHTTHGWTIRRVENLDHVARIFVREEPGFAIDPSSGAARFYQFPQSVVPGPHDFQIAKISREKK